MKERWLWSWAGGVPRLVSFISSVMTLLPGDVVEVKIEGIGTLRNYVVSLE